MWSRHLMLWSHGLSVTSTCDELLHDDYEWNKFWMKTLIQATACNLHYSEQEVFIKDNLLWVISHRKHYSLKNVVPGICFHKDRNAGTTHYYTQACPTAGNSKPFWRYFDSRWISSFFAHVVHSQCGRIRYSSLRIISWHSSALVSVSFVMVPLSFSLLSLLGAPFKTLIKVRQGRQKNGRERNDEAKFEIYLCYMSHSSRFREEEWCYCYSMGNFLYKDLTEDRPVTL